MSISKEAVLKTATEEAKRLGFKLEEMILLNPDVIEEWNNYYEKVYSNEEGVPETYVTEWRATMESGVLKDQLGNKNYETVYFGPRKPMRGGDLWVFIDKANGAVIAHLRGK